MPDTTFLFEPAVDAARPLPWPATLTWRIPGPGLAERLVALWHWQGDRATGPRERLLPTGMVQLVMDLDAPAPARVSMHG